MRFQGKNISQSNFVFLIIPLLSVILHWQVFTKDLMGQHVWRQTQTQQYIDCFYENDFNILNPSVSNLDCGETGLYRMEFPLYQWFVALMYKIFHPEILITRIVAFIVSMAGAYGVFLLLFSLFKNRKTALAGAFIYCFSPLFFYYSVNPLPDNLALSASVFGILYFVRFSRDFKLQNLWLSGLAMSLSTLSKMPFIVLSACFFVFIFRYFFQKKEIRLPLKWLLIYFICLIPAFLWYGWVLPEWENGVTSGLLSGNFQMNQLAGYAWQHFSVTLPELLLGFAVLPLFVLGWFYFFRNKLFNKPLFSEMAFTGLAVILYFVFELNMIAGVHDYYLMPFLPVLIIITATGIHFLIKVNGLKAKLVLIFLLIIAPVHSYLRIFPARWNENKPGFNKDLLIFKNELRKAVPEGSVVIAGNDNSPFIFLYYIHKKGWVFSQDEVGNLTEMEAEYLYSDSREAEKNPQLAKRLDGEIAEFGSIKVFRLKKTGKE